MLSMARLKGFLIGLVAALRGLASWPLALARARRGRPPQTQGVAAEGAASSRFRSAAGRIPRGRAPLAPADARTGGADPRDQVVVDFHTHTNARTTSPARRCATTTPRPIFGGTRAPDSTRRSSPTTIEESSVAGRQRPVGLHGDVPGHRGERLACPYRPAGRHAASGPEPLQPRSRELLDLLATSDTALRRALGRLDSGVRAQPLGSARHAGRGGARRLRGRERFTQGQRDHPGAARHGHRARPRPTNRFVVGVSDNHGWGATSMVWNLVEVPGWRDRPVGPVRGQSSGDCATASLPFRSSSVTDSVRTPGGRVAHAARRPLGDLAEHGLGADRCLAGLDLDACTLGPRRRNRRPAIRRGETLDSSLASLTRLETACYAPAFSEPASPCPTGSSPTTTCRRLMDTTDEWIRTRTGIQERRWVREGETGTEMALARHPPGPGDGR